MVDNIDFLLAKLVEPIERLDINARAYHTLRRNKLQTIADVVYLGEKNISRLRNVGALQVNNIFLAVANYLGIPKEKLSTNEFKQIVLAQRKRPIDPLRLSITTLNLSDETITLLQSAQVISIDDLIKSRSNQYKNIVHLGAKFITKVDTELDNFLGIAIELSEKNVNQHPEEIAIQQKIDLTETLALLKIRDRTWIAIELRANHSRTLEEIASEIGGVTRERARQIIEGACEKVDRNLYLLTDFFDYFELRARKIQSKLSKDDPIDLESLILNLNGDLASSNLVATHNDIKNLITLIRILVIHRNESNGDILTKKWKRLTFLCCLVNPPIEKHRKVNLVIAEKEKNSKKLRYKELAYLILQKAQKPMHWTEIAEEGYKINNRENFDTRGIYHALLRYEDLFVRVAQGTYELTEWGNKTVDAYPDIIAAILKEENHAMAFDTIFAKVSSIRSIKLPSFTMYLELHPRFYKSINQLYGLRGWLPSREKQTLRTPEWLVEDSKSLERVERSEIKGYDIDKYLDSDKFA